MVVCSGRFGAPRKELRWLRLRYLFDAYHAHEVVVNGVAAGEAGCACYGTSRRGRG